ncbi:MAG: hypothetical protein LBK01_00915 [Burkholderiaceae bacterium]|jgi:hypothetical protein|nr:hypothetical protein [Burkholderiaceae bacterium]
MKTLLLCLTILLMTAQAWAAPYDLQQPPESYTWGESQAVVKSKVPEARIIDKRTMYLPPSHAERGLILTFWKNQLLSIANSSGRIDDMAAAQAQYQKLKEKLSAQWGMPSAPVPCSGNESGCTAVTWQPALATTLRLALIVRETPDGQRISISYSHNSSQLFPQFAKEIKELGRVENMEYVMPLLIAGKNPNTLIGKRIRLTLPVAKLKPLTLDARKYSVVCQMRDDKELRGLREREEVTVSGLIDGVESKTILRLSGVKLVDRPRQAARASQGYFQVERLADTLERAAGQVERGFSVKDMLSEPYKADGKVVVDFSPPVFPKGLSFSLDNVLPDNSSNTLSLKIVMPQRGPQPHGYLLMAGMGIVLYASQPDTNMYAQFDKINSAMKAGRSMTINGWTYEGHSDENVSTFSATAPGR